MTRNRELRGFVIAFFTSMFGMMLCVGGTIEYLVRGEQSGAMFKICTGIAVIVIVRQGFDFYNFQMLRLVKRYKERKRCKKQKKSAEGSVGDR